MREVRVAACGRIEDVDADTDRWLRELAGRIVLSDHLVGGETLTDAVLRSDEEGWHAGPFVGELWFTGGRLVIDSGDGSDAVAASAVGALWCSLVESATRHGPPAFRQDVAHVGASLRGRLDVRGSVRLRAVGSSDIASVYRARDLRNDISRALVAAERTLTRQIGDDRWRTRRVREVMPQLRQAVGRDRLPTLAELGRIRYTPITRPYREVAELSVRIVSQDPVVTTTERGRPQGVLLPMDVAARLRAGGVGAGVAS